MKKHILPTFLLLVLCLSLLSTAALAETTAVSYLDADGNAQSCTDYTLVTDSDTNVSWEEGWYVVQGTVTIDGKLTTYPKENVNLLLCDNAELKVTNGLHVNGSLTVYAQSTGSSMGKLTALGTEASPYGIQAHTMQAELTINGGKISATAPSHDILSTGIHMVYMTVNGGEVTANAGTSAQSSYGMEILTSLTLNGGTVTAQAGAATTYSIGLFSNNGTLTVNGGTLNVSGADQTMTTSTKISLYNYGIFTANSASLLVTGGTVNAKGGALSFTASEAAADLSSVGISLEKVEITGGSVTATGGNVSVTGELADNRAYSLGLYSHTPLKISGGAVTATAGSVTGYNGATSTALRAYDDIIISGGTVTATGGKATAIATEYPYYFSVDSYGVDCDNLTVSGGTVTLKSDTVTATAPSALCTSAGLWTDKLDVSGGSIKLPEGSTAHEVTVSGDVTLKDLLDSGCAYWQTDYFGEEEFGFVTLGDLTVLPSEDETEEISYRYTVKTCTHSGSSGTCDYCGEDVSSNSLWPLLGLLGAADRDADNFTDVTPNDYFYDAVDWALSEGITDGISATAFGSNAPCTRAQTVTFLWRAAGCPNADYPAAFADVPATAYYAEAVSWAAFMGIVEGYGNGLFGSDDPITREQMVVILYRFAQAMGLDTTQGGMAVREFSDYESISAYALSAMQWAVNTGMVQGSNGSLLPQSLCTRAQIITMLYRFLG